MLARLREDEAEFESIELRVNGVRREDVSWLFWGSDQPGARENTNAQGGSDVESISHKA